MPLEHIDFISSAIACQAYGHCDTFAPMKPTVITYATLPNNHKGSFIYAFTEIEQHIPQPLKNQLWSTGWNGK